MNSLNFYRLLFSVLLSLFLVSAEASEKTWDIIDKKVRQESLCDAFVDGQVSVFKRKSCSEIGCDEWLYEVTTKCSTHSNGLSTATLIHSSKGKIYSSETLSEERWIQHNRNLLRILAANIESYGNKFEIEEISELNDEKIKVNFAVLRNNKKIESGHWILGNGPSIPQILEKSQTRKVIFTETNTDTLIR